MCLLTKLSFEPPVIYCTSCGLKIKRGQTFHSTPPSDNNDLRGYFCHQCYNEHKGERIVMEAAQFKKADLVVRPVYLFWLPLTVHVRVEAGY